MKIQADIPKELNKKLKMVKLVNDFNDLPETIVKLLGKILDSDIIITTKLSNLEFSIMRIKK